MKSTEEDWFMGSPEEGRFWVMLEVQWTHSWGKPWKL
jgi:hypothetical protein